MTKNNPIVMRKFFDEPWVLEPGKLEEIARFIRPRMNGTAPVDIDEVFERRGEIDITPTIHALGLDGEVVEYRGLDAFALEPGAPAGGGAVAVLPVMGVLSYRMNMMSDMSGGSSTQKLSSQFRDLVASPNISTIMLDIDSPGGHLDGIIELASDIRAARATKHIVGMANTTAASAAYWLISQADEVVVSPSGQVGAIGVFVAHTDFTEAEKMEGMKTTLIAAGRYKVEQHGTLSPEAEEYIQGQVNTIYDSFTADVARGRGIRASVVRNGFGQGRMLLANDALAAGMVDRIEPMHSTIARLLRGPGRRGGARGEAVDRLDFSAELDAIDGREDGDRGIDEIEIAQAELNLTRARG